MPGGLLLQEGSTTVCRDRPRLGQLSYALTDHAGFEQGVQKPEVTAPDLSGTSMRNRTGAWAGWPHF
jgi:hypothetical protein